MAGPFVVSVSGGGSVDCAIGGGAGVDAIGRLGAGLERLDALVLGRTLRPYMPCELCGCAPPWWSSTAPYAKSACAGLNP